MCKDLRVVLLPFRLVLRNAMLGKKPHHFGNAGPPGCLDYESKHQIQYGMIVCNGALEKAKSNEPCVGNAGISSSKTIDDEGNGVKWFINRKRKGFDK